MSNCFCLLHSNEIIVGSINGICCLAAIILGARGHFDVTVMMSVDWCIVFISTSTAAMIIYTC